MKRKCIAMLLAASLALAAAGCGGDNPEGSEAKSGAQESQKTNQTAEQSESQAETGGGDGGETLNLYGYDEPVTVKIGVSYAAASDWSGFIEGETVENNSWMDLYRTNNIMPEIMYEVDPSQASTKLSTAIMSGDYPDIFEGTFAEYKNYVQSGVAADITEAFEKYASEELKEYLYADGGMSMDGLYMDGRLYGLPKVANPYYNTSMMWIRQDWLDNLGLEIPETIEELREVARAFTFDDPDGNGKNDTYGLALDGVKVFNGSIGDTDPVFNAFGCYPAGLTYVENEAGEIVWGGANKEGAKAALQVLRDMYEEGSLAKDFITMDADSIFDEAGAGKCGIWFAPKWGGQETSKGAVQTDPNCHIVAAPIPTGTDEPTKVYVSSVKPSGSVYFVSSKCENAEVLIKVMNLAAKYCNPSKCTAEEYNMYFEKSRWKMAIIPAAPSNGRVAYEALQEALATGDASRVPTNNMNSWNAFTTYIEKQEMLKKGETLDFTDAELQAAWASWTVYGDPMCGWSVTAKVVDEERYINSAYNKVASEQVSEDTATLNKLTAETVVKIITGAQEVESWDAFLDTWYALGGQNAMDEANADR